jgi:hypothetical protein
MFVSVSMHKRKLTESGSPAGNELSYGRLTGDLLDLSIDLNTEKVA